MRRVRSLLVLGLLGLSSAGCSGPFFMDCAGLREEIDQLIAETDQVCLEGVENESLREICVEFIRMQEEYQNLYRDACLVNA